MTNNKSLCPFCYRLSLETSGYVYSCTHPSVFHLLLYTIMTCPSAKSKIYTNKVCDTEQRY